MIFFLIVQGVVRHVAVSAMSPWMVTGSVGHVVVSLENERDTGVSVAWQRAPDDPWRSDEPLAFDGCFGAPSFGAERPVGDLGR